MSRNLRFSSYNSEDGWTILSYKSIQTTLSDFTSLSRAELVLLLGILSLSSFLLSQSRTSLSSAMRQLDKPAFFLQFCELFCSRVSWWYRWSFDSLESDWHWPIYNQQFSIFSQVQDQQKVLLHVENAQVNILFTCNYHVPKDTNTNFSEFVQHFQW